MADDLIYKYSLVLGKSGPDSERLARSWDEIERAIADSNKFWRERDVSIRVTSVYYTINGGPIQEYHL